MSTPEATPKRLWLKLTLFGVGIVILGTAAFFGWTAVEKHVLAQRIHLLASESQLRVGMTQVEVENTFGVRPENRKAPDPSLPAMWPPRPHDGVMRYSEDRDRNGTYINYSEWYRGLIVTSQHHIHVTYVDGKVKTWQRL